MLECPLSFCDIALMQLGVLLLTFPMVNVLMILSIVTVDFLALGQTYAGDASMRKLPENVVAMACPLPGKTNGVLKNSLRKI